MSAKFIGKILALLLVAMNCVATVESSYCVSGGPQCGVEEECGCVHQMVVAAHPESRPVFNRFNHESDVTLPPMSWEHEPPVPPPNA